MNTYIALLRGINVGGHKKIKMADLREMFEDLDAKDVSTYIQSGNVVFHHVSRSEKSLISTIEKAIRDVFGFEASVIIRTLKEFEAVVENNPFKGYSQEDDKKTYIAYLDRLPDPKLAKQLETESYNLETYRVIDRQVYIYLQARASDKSIRFNPNWVEKMLKVRCTTRNIRSTEKILELAEK